MKAYRKKIWDVGTLELESSLGTDKALTDLAVSAVNQHAEAA